MNGMTIKSKSLSLVNHKLDTTMIELEEGAWNFNFDILSWVQRRGEGSSISWSEKGPGKLWAICVSNFMEGIVLKEESVKNLVAVLLIDIPALEFSGLIFNT